MEFEQIAMVADEKFETALPFHEKGIEWTRDIVEAKGVIRSHIQREGYIPIHNVAELRFNYSIFPGKEFELIHYIRGQNFIGCRQPGSMSHYATHVPVIDDFREYLSNKGFELIQEVVTMHHTNVPGDRHYHYAIFKHSMNVVHWKLIERLPDVEAWNAAQREMEARYNCDIF